MSENDTTLIKPTATENTSADDVNQADNEKEYISKLKANNGNSKHNDEVDDIDHDDHDKSHSENQDDPNCYHPARKREFIPRYHKLYPVIGVLN